MSMRVGIATDHGGFALEEDLLARLRAAGHAVAQDPRLLRRLAEVASLELELTRTNS